MNCLRSNRKAWVSVHDGTKNSRPEKSAARLLEPHRCAVPSGASTSHALNFSSSHHSGPFEKAGKSDQLELLLVFSSPGPFILFH